MSTPVICPECGGKTQTYVYKETVMRHFPLFCRHCKKTFDVCKDAYKEIRVTRE